MVGLGLNVRMPRDAAREIDQPWIDLAEIAPQATSRNMLAAVVLERLLPALPKERLLVLAVHIPLFDEADKDSFRDADRARLFAA